MKHAVKTNAGNKTAVVTHLSEVDVDSIVGAMNARMLGARLLQSGGAETKKETTQRGWQGLLIELRNPNSTVSRALLCLQCVAFVFALTTEVSGFGSYPSQCCYMVVVLLAYSLMRKAMLSLLARRVSMHVLMLIVLVGSLGLRQYREAATVALLVSASEWVVGHAHSAVEAALEKSLVGATTHATRLSTPGGPRTAGISVKINELCPGDVVLIKSGNVVPTDGRVLQSDGLMVDEAAVTGEALPAEKQKDAQLLSGTVVSAGVAEVECTATAADSFQGRMRRAVEEARGSRSDTEELMNKFAGIYTPIVVVGSFALALFTMDLSRGLTALVSACPCAIVAAAPVVQSCAFVRLLSDLQVLVKDARTLEVFAQLTELGMDKTGTLTKGAFELVEATVLPAAGNETKDNLMKLLAAVEAHDSHPLANCLVRSYMGCAAEYVSGGGPKALPAVKNFTRVESLGVWGIIEGRIIGAGSASFMDSMAVDLPEEAEQLLKEWEGKAGAFTPVFMSIDDDVVMVLRLEDEVRADAKAAVTALRGFGVELSMLTGDGQRAADLVGKQLGMSKVFAKLKPTDKEAWVRRQQAPADGSNLESLEEGLQAPFLAKRPGAPRSSRTIGMLGDGLNDGPALAAADVGIAIASGLQLTADAADVVIGSGGSMLLRMAQALHLTRRCKALITQNLVFAALVKTSALLLAASGHLKLSLGVLSDSGSLLLVLLNSLRPLWWQMPSFANPAARSESLQNS
eukprot:TRINITY_DN16277_c1_g1_i1.p1 TRINITY_DN16277_c1_g1~~TRINITY_DN16277_c1_g1_i1.p1  ORF type:complete len:744 (-),score=164.01 TRINITY_DN16277_c1_g1_i1:186-2417(-)